MKNIIIKLFEDAGITYKETASGRELITRCPFHGDKSPSFSINTLNGLWNCFACHEKGNVERLAHKLTGKRIDLRELLGEDDAIRLKMTQAYEDHLGELVRKEGKKQSDFQLIWNYECMNNFVPISESKKACSYLKSRGFDIGFLESFGLKYSKDGKFEGRIIIPYMKSNKCIGFNSRLIDTNDKRKRYLYELDGDLFNGFIYGLDRVRNTNTVILVEGPFDLLWMHQLGFKNAVSTLSTNFNIWHLHSLIDYQNYVFLFDNDENKSGQKGAHEAMKLILNTIELKKTYFALLPDFKDPNASTKEEIFDAIKSAKQVVLKEPIR